jgi:hypothetical protein
VLRTKDWDIFWSESRGNPSEIGEESRERLPKKQSFTRGRIGGGGAVEVLVSLIDYAHSSRSLHHG